jgi:Ca2+ transporting ATPase
LNWVEWKAVLYFSLPVIAIDEVLKFLTANFVEKPQVVKYKKE